MNYPLPSDNFGFHAQQAVEKLLKALISARAESIHSFTTLER
jgi:HEPN domain-containing protein